MKKLKCDFRSGLLVLIVLLAAFSRLIPHPLNFAPVGAMALFGVAYFNQRVFAFLFPILAMFLSDLVLNNVVFAGQFEGFTLLYPGAVWTYASFVLIGLVGLLLLKKVKPLNLLAASISASVLFFLVSNFGFWSTGLLYPMSFEGLMACYTAGLPFFKNTLLGDLFYTAVLFGAFELIQARFPVLKPALSGNN